MALHIAGEAAAADVAANIKSYVSKLRKHVPVSSGVYALDIAYEVDVVKLERALAAGRISAALSAYQDGLLKDSTAPYLERRRDQLETHLVTATLDHGDAADLVVLADKLGDDLGVWEAALHALEAVGDPRSSYARVKCAELSADYGVGV